MVTFRNRDWETIIARLNASKSGKLTIPMGSPGSAQVTRCRLLQEYRNLRVTTAGTLILLSLNA